MPPAEPTVQPATPSPFAKGLLTFVGLIRAVYGVGCILAPALAVKFIGIANLSPEASILCRLFGVRDIVIGWLLLLAHAKRTPISGDGEVRRAIWWNIVMDGLDALTLGLAFAQGDLEAGLFGKMVGGSLLDLGMGLALAWSYV
ncbi:hypothetical protein OQA88_8275 [Cercophora sp. LCS_1]